MPKLKKIQLSEQAAALGYSLYISIYIANRTAALGMDEQRKYGNHNSG